MNNNTTTATTALTTTPKTNNNKGMSLTEDTVSKIVELRRRMWRHPNVFPNPDEVMRYVKYFCLIGDNKFLDERLAEVRMLEVDTGKVS